MLTRKEVSKRLKAKARQKRHGGKSLHIYIPESMYKEKTDMAERQVSYGETFGRNTIQSSPS
jgi:hypothetical protein